MAVTIQLTFPAGRYHATPWGRHVNEGAAEWPPSPWRLLRGLIAVWKRTCRDVSSDQAERVLQQLVRSPRLSTTFAPRRPHTTLHALGRKRGPQDRALVLDTFVSVGRNDPLLIGWPEASLREEDETCLRRLIGNLNVLGRAESWVEAQMNSLTGPFDAVEWNCVPAPDTNENAVSVLCSDPATCFGDENYPVLDPKKLARGKVNPSEFLFDCPSWHLCLDTETIHAARWPIVPGAKWVNYTRPEERLLVNVIHRRPHQEKPTFARFLLDAPVLPLVIDTLPVAEAFRRAVMGCFGTWCGRHQNDSGAYRRMDERDMFASPLFSGKDKHAVALTGQRHAHYLPGAVDCDVRHIRCMTMFARDGFDPPELSAMASLKNLTVGRLGTLRVQLIGLGQSQDFDRTLSGPSSTWRSLTPFLGHCNIGRIGKSRYLRKGLRREWRRLAEQVPEFQNVELCDIVELSPEEVANRGGPQAREFRRARSKHGGREAYRAAAMYRLVFSRPISGPICLGYASHFGMGLFVPYDE